MIKSQGRAIVNVGQEINQLDIAARVGFNHVTVQDIIDDKVSAETDKYPGGIVVTGYSNQIISDGIDIENKVQNFVRSLYNNVTAGKGKDFSILILSNSLPDTGFMDVNLRWYNGPFSINDPVWSLKTDENNVVLVHNKKEIKFIKSPKPKKIREWVEEQQEIF